MSYTEINIKEVTIYDIASRLSLNPSTVSRALQDHPAVKDDTKKKILALAKALGYRHNNYASNIRRQRTNTIGAIVPKLNSNFMSTVLAGIENIVSREKYNFVIGQSLESLQKEVQQSEMLFNTRVDGLIVSLSNETDNMDHFEPFFKKQIPIVFFDRVPNLKEATVVTIDNYRAAYNATLHLISQGCKTILHITSNRTTYVYEDRLKGYRKALEENGLEFNESNVIFGDLTPEFGETAARKIISMQKRPEGVFICNDFCAVACMAALKKAGFSIPKDIAFVGFNNDPVSTIIDPALTTIHYPGYEMGAIAAQYLVDHLGDSLPNKAPRQIILRSDLIIRASSMRGQKQHPYNRT